MKTDNINSRSQIAAARIVRNRTWLVRNAGLLKYFLSRKKRDGYLNTLNDISDNDAQGRAECKNGVKGFLWNRFMDVALIYRISMTLIELACGEFGRLSQKVKGLDKIADDSRELREKMSRRIKDLTKNNE